MKRMLLWMLCGSLLLSAVACGAPAEENSAPVTDGDATGTTENAGTTGSTEVACNTSATTSPAGTTTRVTEKGTHTPALSDYALAQPVYAADEERMRDGIGNGLTAYYRQVLPAFLSGDTGKNRVCSPLNVYLALSMLAETAQGNTRQQLLTLLGASGIAAVRERSSALWNGLYRDGDSTKCLLANSLWLSETESYRPETVRQLADDYYAAVFQGRMGDDAYSAALRTWINDRTGGLLKEQAAGEKFTADQILALVSTVYFKSAWATAFRVEDTADAVFHAATGDVTCAFMHSTERGRAVYRGAEYSAVRRFMWGEFAMWFILPDEGVTVDALLHGAEVTAMLAGDNEAQWQDCDLVLKVPKFDVAEKRDLRDALKQLGVTDAFAPGRADLSAIFGAQNSRTYVSGINHSARVTMDEEGVEAAAYTGITVAKTAMPKKLETVYFTVDRPFLFAVTGTDNTLLFAGVIEDPTKK